jgi:hypothetical protein
MTGMPQEKPKRYVVQQLPADLVKQLQHATGWNIEKCAELISKVPQKERELFVQQMCRCKRV